MRIKAAVVLLCRRASADFGLLVTGCACALAVNAKDVEVPVVAAPPKPVVLQPSVVAPAPVLAPPQPEASARTKKTAKASKRQAAKPVAKSKPKPKRR
jgi:hypothetical protein